MSLEDHADEVITRNNYCDWFSNLKPGEYYFRKKDGTTMRFDGWAMQMWENGRVCWTDVPPLNELEEVTWGTKAIPLQDFSHCEHY